MKICMVGLGSIGQRHLRNIVKVLSERSMAFTVDALRVEGKEIDQELTSLISKTYYSIAAVPDDYDVVFVTNPTALHYETVKQFSHKTQHMFIEKPVFEKYREISDLCLGAGVYYVACPLRHKKVIRYIKKQVEQGAEFHSIRAISSSYLPDWRRGVDYRKVYSADKELGGGVELDLIHEWDYIAYLFGLPEKMYKLVGHCSKLEIDSDDIAVYIARYADKMLELHLDYFGTETVRKLELIGNQKKYIVDINNNTINTIERAKEEKRVDFGQDDFYLSEMEYFFDLVQRGEKSFNEMDRANNLMKFVLEEQR